MRGAHGGGGLRAKETRPPGRQGSQTWPKRPGDSQSLGNSLGEAGRPVRRAEDRLNTLYPRKAGACSTRRNMAAPFIPRDEAAAGGNRSGEEGLAGRGGSSSSEVSHSRSTRALPRCRNSPRLSAPPARDPTERAGEGGRKGDRQTQRKAPPTAQKAEKTLFPTLLNRKPQGVRLPVAKTS